MSDDRGGFPLLDLSSHNDEKVLRELLHQGETCLSEILRLAIAADTRATAFCGVFGAAGVTLLAISAANFSSQHSEWALILSIIVAAILFLCASGLAATAGRPIDFYIGGYEPRRLAPVADHLSQLRFIVTDIQVRIDANSLAMKRSATRVNCAMGLALLAVITGALTFFFVRFSHSS
jgi:hypothetical protein